MSSITNVFSPMHAVDWGIEDPKGKPIEKVREIRDEIEEKTEPCLMGRFSSASSGFDIYDRKRGGCRGDISDS